jgi:hypothetical protein
MFSKGNRRSVSSRSGGHAEFGSSNDGNSYILTCIDVFSRYAFAGPVKDKRGSTVAAAFEKIFARARPQTCYRRIAVRNSTTCRCRSCSKRTACDTIRVSTMKSKRALVERFNRTLKSRLFRYMTRSHTKRWIDVIDDVVHSCNRSHRRSIGTAPIDVTSKNEDEITRRQYPPKPPFKYRYDVGDRVRIVKYKHVFSERFTCQIGRRRSLRSSTGIRHTPLRTDLRI